MVEKNRTEARVEAKAADGDEKPKKLRYHFIKSNAFRSIHADGVFGGVTPRLTIAATFFNERPPLPDQTVHEINDNGTVGDEIKDERISRDGIVRELEANLIMDVEFAKALRNWLTTKIDLIEEQLKEQKEEKVKEDPSDALIG